MEPAFRPIPLEALARWILDGLDRGGETVLGIPTGNFEVPDRRLVSRPFGRPLAAPLGVAAGPHTQLAQNIVAAWLCGARFIELKTVQVLDELQVPRPCIDSADLTFNVEWSQELKLEQSFEEYLKAWVLIHALAQRLGLPHGPGVHFAMSVGYDLPGIQSPGVKAFLARMRDAREPLARAVEAVARVAGPQVRELEISATLSDHVTLSTMHGCPPAAIEQIALYLMRSLGLHTWVKLNPTLLGPDRLRGLLNDQLGHEDVTVPDAAFEHDPCYEDAVEMIDRLAAASGDGKARFGVKLSNTLEVLNERTVFGSEQKTTYLSGRALHPVTLVLAHQLTESLAGSVPISFCGGADADSFPDLVADGLGPVTVCSDLLKPGGYARLQQYVVNLERAMAVAGADTLEAYVAAIAGPEGGGARANLARHAARAIEDPRYARRDRPLEFKGERALGHFDCIAAPCQEACPTGQPIPEYLRWIARGAPSRALEAILRTNAMPGTTGSICERPCTERCVRAHYDAPVAIRELKRFAVENGSAPVRPWALPRPTRVAVVGAGPAGLAAAYHLALGGVAVTLLEARTSLGGLVESVIPRFRFDPELLEQDLERIRRLGVEVRLGKRLGRDYSLESLRKAHDFVFLALGAQAGRRLGIPGEEAAGIFDAIDMLERVRRGAAPTLGRRVLVVGGGNSAVDAARAARRLVREGSVEIVYRRGQAHMPADPGEVGHCLDEGVVLRDRLIPARVLVRDGHVAGLACARVRLGPADASGRPQPVRVEGGQILLPCDTIVVAIGQRPAVDFGEGGSPVPEHYPDGVVRVEAETRETSLPGVFAGGDLVRGPASVVDALGDGLAAAREILRRSGGAAAPAAKAAAATDDDAERGGASLGELLERKARRRHPQSLSATMPVTARGGFEPVEAPIDAEAAACEASRCLECDRLCSLCVTVCPNRANQAFAVAAPLRIELPRYRVRGGALEHDGGAPSVLEVAQAVQIVHFADACNACGNCTTFCPTSGAPYLEKPRFWLDAQGFRRDPRDAFHWFSNEGEVGATGIEARLDGAFHRLEVAGARAEYRTERIAVELDPASWAVRSARIIGPVAEADVVSLDACARLIVLLATRQSLPNPPALIPASNPASPPTHS